MTASDPSWPESRYGNGALALVIRVTLGIVAAVTIGAVVVVLISLVGQLLID